MVHPFDNLGELGWKHLEGEPSAVTRPLAGAELVLDQIRRLNDGMSDLVSGIQVTHTFTPELLQERLREACLRLRFHSPLIAAHIVHSPEATDLGTWIYRPVDLPGAIKWRDNVLHFHELPHEGNFVDAFIQERLSKPLPYDEKGGTLFHCHIFTEKDGSNAVILVHACHVILDGPAILDCIYLLLDYAIHPEQLTSSEELAWGTEVQNLPPHPVEMFGGTLAGWEVEGMQMLEEFDRILGEGKPSHSLVPQRQQNQQPVITQKVSHRFSKDETADIIESIKSLQSTVTVALEAAHILATLKLNPPVGHEGRTVLFPSIVAVRHLMKAPWDRRSTLVITGGAIPLVVEHSTLQLGTEYEKMVVIMKDLKAQYNKWLSIPHHPMLVPAQSAISPITAPISTPGAEITNLGVIERRLPLGWYGQAQGYLSVQDFFLGLRRAAPVLMTHAWTLEGHLHIQCQGNDLWDISFMDAFLKEIIRFVTLKP